MIFYIYLGVSILTLTIMILTNLSLIHNVKEKTKDIPDKRKKDRAGLVNAFLKIAVISFIPLVNLFFLLLMIFYGEEINKNTNKMIDEAIKKSES
jgi:hypothetical protein